MKKFISVIPVFFSLSCSNQFVASNPINEPINSQVQTPKNITDLEIQMDRTFLRLLKSYEGLILEGDEKLRVYAFKQIYLIASNSEIKTEIKKEAERIVNETLQSYPELQLLVVPNSR